MLLYTVISNNNNDLCHWCPRIVDIIASGCEEDEEKALDYESRALLQFCEAQQHLLNTYTELHNINSDTEYSMDIKPNSEASCVCVCVCTSMMPYCKISHMNKKIYIWYSTDSL